MIWKVWKVPCTNSFAVQAQLNLMFFSLSQIFPVTASQLRTNLSAVHNGTWGHSMPLQPATARDTLSVTSDKGHATTTKTKTEADQMIKTSTSLQGKKRPISQSNDCSLHFPSRICLALLVKMGSAVIWFFSSNTKHLLTSPVRVSPGPKARTIAWLNDTLP